MPVSGLIGVTAIAGGRDMSYAIRSDGTLWAWGLDSDGELGDGTLVNRRTPLPGRTLTNVIAIAGRQGSRGALLAGGTVWTCGDNAYGELGDGTSPTRSTPVQVTGLSGIVAVSAGAHRSYALRANATVAALAATTSASSATARPRCGGPQSRSQPHRGPPGIGP